MKSGYSTAIVTRLHPTERDHLNAQANSSGMSLQQWARVQLGLAAIATSDQAAKQLQGVQERAKENCQEADDEETRRYQSDQETHYKRNEEAD